MDRFSHEIMRIPGLQFEEDPHPSGEEEGSLLESEIAENSSCRKRDPKGVQTPTREEFRGRLNPSRKASTNAYPAWK